MDDNHVQYMKRCYELAISAGKKGYDSFGAVLVHNGEILEEAENTADYAHGIFGHAEFNLVHKCANKYSDEILGQAVVIPAALPANGVWPPSRPLAYIRSCAVSLIGNSASCCLLIIRRWIAKGCSGSWVSK